jgi:hypothetical protein
MSQASRSRSSYVYGIVPSGDVPSFEQRGVGEAGELRTVASGRIAAIVSTISAVPVRASRANLMAHSDVLQEAIATSTVLPMQFGFVMASDDAVREELLEPRQAELEGLLEDMAGRVEMGVKAYYLEDALLRGIVTENRTIAEIREATRRLPGDAGYYQRIRLGELIVSAITTKREHDASHLLRRLHALAVKRVTETEIPERMVLKAWFLVERGRVRAFQRLVAELAEENSHSMQLTCLGPLPPYNFVRLAPAGKAAVATG